MGYSTLSRYRSELMGTAMLWVMLFHAFDLVLPFSFLNWLRAAGFGGVDIFILLSGVGLVRSLNRREQTAGEFLARRAKRILPAYYSVMLPYTLFLILAQDGVWSSLLWNSSLLYYWVRCPGAFNWYVAGIVLFYLITPVCFQFLRARSHRVWWTLAGICAGVLLCQLLMQEGYWQYTDIFYRLPVFLLGLWIGFLVEEDRSLRPADKLVWLGVFLAGVTYLFVSYKMAHPHVFMPLCHLFLFTTVPLCLALCWCFRHLPLGALRRFLRLVGENSLEIYLLNVSAFSQVALLRNIFPFGSHTYLYYAEAFAVNILLGILLHRGIAAVSRRRVRSAAE